MRPQLLKGFRDFGPQEMAQRLYVIDMMRKIFTRHGYQPLETPALEYAETILGKYGQEGDKLTYNFKDQGDRQVALRYDQTVPTARFVAMNWANLAMPFKRYAIGPVWRADKPQHGRFREFYQCDLDIIGATSLYADAELAKVIYDVLSSLDINNFVIRVNSRRLIEELFKMAKIKKSDTHLVLRIVDKMDKLPLSQIKLELAKLLKTEQVDWLIDNMLGEKVRADLEQLPDSPATQELQELFKYFTMLNIPAENIMLDLSLARGLDYYTGPIYEVIIPNSGLGSICGGGRYDNLTAQFSNKKFSGTGVAFGLDRLLVYLNEQNKLKHLNCASTVLLINFADTIKENLSLLNTLHQADIKAELYVDNAKLSQQFKYADKKMIPWVIMQGEDEVKAGMVILRDMKSGEQVKLSMADVIAKLKL